MFFGGHFLFFFFIWSSLKLQSLGLFEEVVHNKKKNNKNRSTDMGSVPDPETKSTRKGSSTVLFC